MFRRFVLIVGILVAALQAGCVSYATANVDPAIRWKSIRSMHVVKSPADEREVHLLIAEKLRTRGFSVTVDPQPNPKADAVVAYQDKWIWDLGWYMLELTVTVSDSQRKTTLATGNSHHSSLVRKSPTAMVDEVLENILKAGQPN